MAPHRVTTTPDPHHPSDEALVARAQNQNLQAFTTLYERYFPVVYRRVRCIVPEPDIEDIVQEVFMSMLTSLSSIDNGAQFGGWIRTLTSRRVADYYRRHNPENIPLEATMNDGPHDPISRSSDTAHSASVDTRVDLQQAFGQLPERYQEILMLRLIEELPFAECAQLMGQSLEATKSLFRRAVAGLRQQLEVSYGRQ